MIVAWGSANPRTPAPLTEYLKKKEKCTTVKKVQILSKSQRNWQPLLELSKNIYCSQKIPENSRNFYDFLKFLEMSISKSNAEVENKKLTVPLASCCSAAKTLPPHLGQPSPDLALMEVVSAL